MGFELNLTVRTTDPFSSSKNESQQRRRIGYYTLGFSVKIENYTCKYSQTVPRTILIYLKVHKKLHVTGGRSLMIPVIRHLEVIRFRIFTSHRSIPT